MVTPPEDGISDSFVAAVAPLSAIEADLLVVTVFGFTAFFLPTDGFLFKKLFWNPNEEDFGLEVRAWVGVPVPVPLPLPSGFAGFLRPSFCLWDSSSSINAFSISRWSFFPNRTFGGNEFTNSRAVGGFRMTTS